MMTPPSSEVLLTEDGDVACQAQISQESLQGAAYRFRAKTLGDLPSSETLLTEDGNVACQAQISQEALQGAVYRLRTANK
jgi:hypothetical protein